MTHAPEQNCFRPGGPIQVDGELAEDSWKQCPRLPSFLKHNGMQIDDPVDARAMWDDENLYFGITCRDDDLVGAPGQRDDDVRRGDAVTILLDPRRNGLGVAQLAVSASGVQSDSLLTGVECDLNDPKLQTGLNDLKLETTGTSWQPGWQPAVALQGTLRAPDDAAADKDTGWTAEIAVPFASLPQTLFPSPRPGHVWNVNVIVTSRGSGPGSPVRTWCLSPTLDPDGVGSPARWMPLRFEAKTVEQFRKEEAEQKK